MISADDIAIGQARLDNGKLTFDDVDSLISVFRILCGPLESDKKYKFEEDLTAIDDTGNTRNKAAKLAGTLARVIDEDFGVDQLRTSLWSNDNDQRRIFALFAFSLLYMIPAELASAEAFEIYLRNRRLRTSSSFAVKTIAN